MSIVANQITVNQCDAQQDQITETGNTLRFGARWNV